MTKVSVVIETINARGEGETLPLVEFLAPPMRALEAQTCPAFEIILVLDHLVDDPMAEEIRQQYPQAKIVYSERSNYFAMKNAGARAATGDLVAYFDCDCVPAPDWIEALLRAYRPGVVGVAGRTRYVNAVMSAATFSISDFATIVADEQGDASGFQLSNVALRRDVLLAHPFEERIPRNGGCYLMYYQLRAEGATIAYARDAHIAHGVDRQGFIRKHFDRGYDGFIVYRLDESGALRGSALVRRVGGLALFPITAGRLLHDWWQLASEWRQMGISLLRVPYQCAVIAFTRMIELFGGLVAAVQPRSRIAS